MKQLLIAVYCLAFFGCSRPLDYEAEASELVGRWLAVQVSPYAEDYFRRSGVILDRDKLPAFEIRGDGTFSAYNLPLVLDLQRAIVCESAVGKWRLHRSFSGTPRTELLLLLDEPKQGVGYECFKDERGFVLRWFYYHESPDAVAFRKVS